MPVTLPRLALLGALLFPVAAAWAAELRLELPGGTQTWSSEELLRHPQARDLDIPADVAYRRNMRCLLYTSDAADDLTRVDL
ncbi:hypothetical protein FA089_20870, partial [Pseudomonas aeruginosa]|nr:hypothetical protein [Pseudomonas aeruginosa]